MTKATIARMTVLGLVVNYLVAWRLSAIAGPDRAQAEPGMSGMAGMPAMPGMSGMSSTPGMSMPTHSHYLRDATAAAPMVVVVFVAVAVIASSRRDSFTARMVLAAVTALATALATVISDALLGALFDAPLQVAAGPHYLEISLVALRYAFAVTVLYAAFFGAPRPTVLKEVT